ncbi:Zinc finger C2H2, partial [Penicillium freii]
VAKGKSGRIEERPTVGTIKGFFRQFVTSIKRERKFDFLLATRTIIKECRDHYKYRRNPTDRARVQLNPAILLYCFTSLQIGESEDTALEARVIATCYKEIPRHAFYEVYAEDIPIFLNLLIFFLLIATIDKAFRDYGSITGPSEDKILKVIYIRGADAFGKALAYGLADNKTDKTYSESIRIKFARQTNRNIYGKSYACPLSEVDRLANYLGIATR